MGGRSISEPLSGLRIRHGGAVDFAGTGEPGADIVLYRLASGERVPLATGEISATGDWQLPAVTFPEPGQYELILETSTDQETLATDIFGIQYRPLPPIVFVPGYYSCTEGILNQDVDWQIPNPPSVLGSALTNNMLNPNTTGLFPPAYLAYAPLLSYFDSLGYTLNETFFVACYNWAGSMRAEAEDVGRAIEYAATHNTSGLPVTILTHSNGGIVSRYFIQSHPQPEVLRTQIESVIMIAPPNHGVARAYYAWEGGDISQEKNFIKLILQAGFAHLNIQDPRCVISPWDYFRNRDAYNQSVFDCLHRDEPWTDLADMPSVAWLVPDGKFLRVSGSEIEYPNAPLKSINTSAANERFFAGIGGGLYILAGTDLPTPGWIELKSPIPNSTRWKNGKPTKAIIKEYNPNSPPYGDDSVLLDSTKLHGISPNDRYKITEFSGAKHGSGIIKRGDVLNQIADILNEDFPPPPLPPTNMDSPMLIIWVESPVNLLVKNPDGKQIGYDETGQFLGEIPSAFYGDTADVYGRKYIVIPEAISGEYQYQVTGLASGEYRVVSLSSSDEKMLTEADGSISAGESQEYRHVYDFETQPTPPPTNPDPSPKIGIPGWILWLGLIICILVISYAVVRKKRRNKNKFDEDGYLYPDIDDNSNQWVDNFDTTKPKRRWFRRKKDQEYYDYD